MAIVWVHEALISGGGVGNDESGTSYTRVFDVLSGSYDDNAKTISVADDGTTAIPSAYAYFSKGNDTDYGSVVTEIACVRNSTYPLLWEVTVTYTMIRANTTDGKWPGGTLTYTSRLPGFRTWGVPVVEVLTKDINGNPIVNSAGQPFATAPEDVRYNTAYEITSWIRNYDATQWLPYADSTNASVQWGFPEETLLMIGPPNGVRKVDTTGTFWEIKREFHYNPTGWKREFEDRGIAKTVDANGDAPTANNPAAGVEPITDEAGIRVGGEVPLDVNGQPLAFGLPRLWKEYTVKEPKNWTPMALPVMNLLW